MKKHPVACRPLLISSLLTAFAAVANAAPSSPSALSSTPADAPNKIAFSWPAVPGATSYKVSVLDSVTGDFGAPVTVSTPNYTTGTLTAGRPVSFIVSAVDTTGESAPSRDFIAQPVTLRDNVDGIANGVTFAGSWQNSSAAGFYGTNSVYAAPVAGSTPSATCTFAGNLPVAGTYDVYLRWNAFSNRATNTPVDIKSGSAVLATVLIDQTINGGQWVKIGTHDLPAGSGTGAASVVIRNNGANGYVIADAVQFVLRTFDSTADYTLTKLTDDFNGTTLDTNIWTVFRPNVTVGGGKLRTKLSYIGTVPLASATAADLKIETNWSEGGVISRQGQKFGYHEARLRIPQAPATGVDMAYWHNALDEILHGYEIDAPEFFNSRTDGNLNSYGFGVWNHFNGARTWDYGKKYTTLGDYTRYITIGLEWRTDNSQVVYVNGQKAYATEPSGMNDTEAIQGTNIILSTKVLDWLNPNAALDGQEALWDYARYYQKPGWIGSESGVWDDSRNWGADGRPGPGFAAVFNVPTAPAAVSLSSDQSLQSLYLDGASLPAHVFSGPGKLLLGTGKPNDTSCTHGGIAMNTSVSANQTFNTAIVGVQNLQFANHSRVNGVALHLNGQISGDGVTSRDIDFLTPISSNASLGIIVLGQPLGSGLHHVTKAGDTPFTLPAGSQHSGELRIARGPVTIPAVSSLGTDPTSSVVFFPRYLHSDAWRPRLTYTGPEATSNHTLRFDGRFPDGILESLGTGPLTWNGDVLFGTPTNLGVIRSDNPRFTLGANAASGNNVFNGNISDAGIVTTVTNADGTVTNSPVKLSLIKSGVGTWILAGDNSVSASVAVSQGKLIVGSGITGTLAVTPVPGATTTPGVSIGSTAEFIFNRDSDIVFSAPISGSGVFRKRGGGGLTLTGNLTYTGTTYVEAGRLAVGSGTSGSITSSSINVSAGAEIAFGRNDNVTISSVISNAGGLRKLGGGTLTLAGANTFTGPVTVESGTLLRNNSGSGDLTILGGVFDLNAGNRNAPTVTVDGGAIVNSTGTSAQYLNTSALYDLRSGSISARLAGTAPLVKSTAGTVFLTGNNTFTGGTVIQAGTLDLDSPGTLAGDLTISGGIYLVHSSTTSNTVVTIQNGGWFQNWGNNIGNVSVQSGGALRNHGSIQGSVTLAAGATADAIGSVFGDLVNAGTITLVGNAPFSVSGTITNTGVIDARYWLGTLPAGLGGTVIAPVPTVSLLAPVGGVAALSGSASQVSLSVNPDGVAPVSVNWTHLSGPSGGTVAFSAPNAAATTATFSTPGIYQLRATVSDARPGRTASVDVTVLHNPFQSVSLRAGVNGYSHTATFLRADTTTWNSGARDQMLVGKSSTAFRPVLSFDLASLPNRPAFASVSLDLWTTAVGVGSVGELQLRELTATPTEGTGDGSNAANGAGTGATWLLRAPAVNWTAPGGDFLATVLSTVAGFSSTEVGTQKTFASNLTLTDRTQIASDAGQPLNLIITSPATESGANNNYVRFASDDHGTSAQRPRLNFVLTPGVPAPWFDADVGATGALGDASALGTASPVPYFVSGSGDNIGSNNDAFHFTYQDASGDCSIQAQITAQQRTDGFAKAGLMIRANTSTNSRNVFLGLTPDGGLYFHARTATGIATNHVAGTPLSGLRPPLWLKLTRSADTYSAYRSTNGTDWTFVASVDITGMPANTLAGLAVTSRIPGTLGTAAFTAPAVTP